MARTIPSKQLSQAEVERFLMAAEALRKSIMKPLISPKQRALPSAPKDTRCAFGCVGQQAPRVPRQCGPAPYRLGCE